MTDSASPTSSPRATGLLSIIGTTRSSFNDDSILASYLIHTDLSQSNRFNCTSTMRPEAPKSEAKSGDGVLGRGSSPFPASYGEWGHCKLFQLGPAERFSCI